MGNMLPLLALAAIQPGQTAPAISIIPKPNILQPTAGAFRLDARTHIVVGAETEAIGYLLHAQLQPGTGLPLDVSRRGGSNTVSLRIDRGLAKLGPEGYVMDVRANGVDIRGAGPAGVFYGVQSLRQLLPARTLRQSAIPGAALDVPCVHIEDAPRFAWRGAMLDVCRHFEPKVLRVAHDWTRKYDGHLHARS